MGENQIVFINVGWMVEYKGPDHDKKTRGGHEWLRNHSFGHESWNFAPRNGKCFGYVPGKNNINIRNFDSASRDSATGVTVVWVARHPESNRYVIVGWYENATIFKVPRKGHFKVGGESVDYQIEADEKNAFLVRREQRTFPTPLMPQIGFGRSVIYYGNEELLGVIPKFIRSKGLWQGQEIPGGNTKGAKKSDKAGGGGRQQDADERKRVEDAAINFATQYYRTELKNKKCVRSVEKECKGWDLEVTQRSGELLLVEVKGTSGQEICVEVTVNEYAKLRNTEFSSRYVLFVVTEAGTSKESGHIFRFREAGAPAGIWRSDDGRELEFKPQEAAKIMLRR